MAGSVNRVILIGNCVADPEVKRTQDGRPIVNLRLATSETWRDKQSGERKSKAEYHRVVIFNENAAKVAEQYLRKGSKVYLEGSLQTREWEDQQGQKRYATEVVLQQFGGQLVLLDRAEGGDRHMTPEEGQVFDRALRGSVKVVAPGRMSPAAAGSRETDPMDDDLPF